MSYETKDDVNTFISSDDPFYRMKRIKMITKTITTTILLNTTYLLAQLQNYTTRKNNEPRNEIIY